MRLLLVLSLLASSPAWGQLLEPQGAIAPASPSRSMPEAWATVLNSGSAGHTSVFRASLALPGTFASVTADTGQAGTFTRASTKSCFIAAGNSLAQAASGNLCVSSSASVEGMAGYSSDGPSTNLNIQSGDLSNAAWTDNTGFTATANQGVFIDGTTTMALLAASGSVASEYQSTTVTSSTGPWTQSVYFSAVSGTVQVAVLPTLNAAQVVSTCTCATSTGIACTATIVNSSRSCQATATVGTSNVRVSATMTATTAQTTVYAQLTIGAFGAGSGSAYGGGSQLEATAFPTPYVSTAATTAARVTDVLSFSTTGVEFGTAGSGSLVVAPEFNFNADGVAHMLFQDASGVLQVYYNSGAQKFQVQTNVTAASASQSFLPYTTHTVYWRYTTGGNTCVQVDAAAEVCTAGTTTFTPGATFVVGGSPTVGAGAWISNVKMCTTALAPGGCT